MMAKKSGHGECPVRWLLGSLSQLCASSSEGLSGLTLDVRGFVAVNQIGFCSFINGGRKSAHGSSGDSFVTSSNGGECFFAKCFDAAFRGAVALRANFGLTDTLLC